MYEREEREGEGKVVVMSQLQCHVLFIEGVEGGREGGREGHNYHMSFVGAHARPLFLMCIYSKAACLLRGTVSCRATTHVSPWLHMHVM